MGDGSCCYHGDCPCQRGGKTPDWQDFEGIIILLVINSTISFIEENNAGNAAAALVARLAPKAKVLRDGRWSEEDAAILVPGDVISIKLRDIVPTDACILEGDPLKIDQSLTCESLPVTKGPGPRLLTLLIPLIKWATFKSCFAIYGTNEDEACKGWRRSGRSRILLLLLVLLL
ncbi:hypothetical protein Vadar_022847 [Vaccinium darrowii]|uniref:Uncharacterized protein n=1 Tax=Vaccinium darrowii TaxID=229202 RepID=A0ACB7X2W7_9ERIC|nr:hypothetical protein Vadar_022847 [Vaccinium darrowii]